MAAVAAIPRVTSAMRADALNWLAHGERGLSSESMCFWLVFGERLKWPREGYPLDPADFRRCQLLLRLVPKLRKRLPLMAECSPVWAALVERWDEITKVLEAEVPTVYLSRYGYEGSAPKAYALMQEIIAAGRTAEAHQ